MTKLKDDYTIEDILEYVKAYLDSDLSIIKDTYNYVINIIPSENTKILNVCQILTTLQADKETIAASILYRLYYYEEYTIPVLSKVFDFMICKLAYGIYKLNKISFSTENDYLVEYYKKVIVGMSEDVRVIIVTLSERVYLMRCLYNYEDKEQKRISKETIEIFAPLAHHLGIYKLKSELEDLSLRYLKPDVYYDIVDKLNSTKTERDNLINEMISEVSNILINHDINYEIKGRSKSIHSIYNKLDKGRKFSDIYDLLALRILVNDEETCYLVLGLIHSKFKPIAKRFKDFIAMPKSNGYQSLHTTVFGVDNELFEIQIRTFEMNEVAENGLAAHWSYKEHRNANNLNSTDSKLEFFKAVIDFNNANSKDIEESFKEDSLEDNIYVFTPKGDVIELPVGSTPVDFAYKVHTKIGDSMVGSMVNNQIVPLNYELQDGDVIKINTSKSSLGPKEDWLSFVKLTSTKNKIKTFFTKNRKEELINLGKELLEKELRRRKISFNDFYKDENLKIIAKEIGINDNIETLYFTIGTNKYNSKYIINIIFKEEEKEEIKEFKVNPKLEQDINVAGIDDVKVNIASCCNPIPGDDIVGYITKNNGITIHRKECENLIHVDDRFVDVCFNPVTKNKYLTSINITITNPKAKLGDILNKITSKNIIIESMRTLFNDTEIIYRIELYVKNLDSLNNLINDLSKTKYVKDVKRV